MITVVACMQMPSRNGGAYQVRGAREQESYLRT
jgi:hypothetical protein